MTTTEKPNYQKVRPSAARPSFFKRPAAFRPLLAEGLALSGESLLTIFSISKKAEFVNLKKVLSKLSFCGLLLEIWYSNMNSRLEKVILGKRYEDNKELGYAL